MPTQEIGVFAFDFPAEWSPPRHLVVFDPPSGAIPTTMVVTRERRAPDEHLETFALRRTLDATRARPQSQLVDARPATFAGRAAFRAVLRWGEDEETVHQAIAWIDAGDGDVLLASMTSARRDDFVRFEETLATLRTTAPRAREVRS